MAHSNHAKRHLQAALLLHGKAALGTTGKDVGPGRAQVRNRATRREQSAQMNLKIHTSDIRSGGVQSHEDWSGPASVVRSLLRVPTGEPKKPVAGQKVRRLRDQIRPPPRGLRGLLGGDAATSVFQLACCGLDSVTGELFQRRLTPTFAEVSAWLAELPGPVAVTYEAGPTGFGLARDLTGSAVRCVVAAPSKLQLPPGDRVKTDARDALHLARLLRMDQIVPVRVPTVEQEAARDLVRAREDVRGDLMRSRHRLSNSGRTGEGSTTWYSSGAMPSPLCDASVRRPGGLVSVAARSWLPAC